MAPILWIFALALASWLLFYITGYGLDSRTTIVDVGLWTIVVLTVRRVRAAHWRNGDGG